MLQTLLLIPHAWLGAPLLFGWLAVGAIASIASIVRHGWGDRTMSTLGLVAVGTVVIYWIIPQIEVLGLDPKNPDGPLVPAGMAIRGYGVFLMLGILGGIALCQIRARQIGVDPDKILSLCFWLTVFGLIGARLFYVIQKWDSYRGAQTAGEMISRLLDMTEGGLVVYGSLFGGILTWVAFCWLNKLSLWKVGDIIAPGMMIGLALGRIGCWLNGCCFGGPCDDGAWCARFPAAAPAYYRQLETGGLLGMQLAERKSPDGTKFQVVTEVQPHSIAELHGIQAGDRILLIAPPADVFLRAIKQAHIALSAPERNSLLVQRDGKPLVIVPAAELPDVSLPTFPAQLVSSINAFLICCLLWFYYPFRRRDGELMAMLLIVYSISRYLEEVIRVDEAGVFGTNLTISQWVSVICLVGGILMMIGLRVFASPAPANPSGAADF